MILHDHVHPIDIFLKDTQLITSICVSPSSKYLLVFTSSLSLRIYEIPSASLTTIVQPIRVVARAHDAPIHVCITDPTSTYLASGSADGVVKVWDILRGYVTHVFKGHGGVVSALVFSYPLDPSSLSQQKLRLITASADTRIRIFDLTARSRDSNVEAVLEGHVSVPRGLDVSPDGKWLISGGRDSVVLIWDLSFKQSPKNVSNGEGKVREFKPFVSKTIPILERVEAIGLLHPNELTGFSSDPDNIRFYTAGEKGVVKIWDCRDSTVLLTLGEEYSRVSDDGEEQRQIVDAMFVSAFDVCYSLIGVMLGICLLHLLLRLFMETKTFSSIHYLRRP
jgi:U3 small nucleolar RNA-associated protein 13